MIELTFLKELMLVKQENQKSEMFVVFLKTLSFNQMYVTDVMIS